LNDDPNELFEYGIQTENSDVRAHVSASSQTVYVFRTVEGLRAIEKNLPPLVPAFQNGVVGRTAEGWKVKFEWITDLRRLRFYSWTHWAAFDNLNLTTTEKGKLAVACVIQMMEIGRFPLWIKASESEGPQIQIKGTDIVLFANVKVQVKCDLPAGRTGNLFLQKAERNPLRRF
jgi:hypothetical protein